MNIIIDVPIWAIIIFFGTTWVMCVLWNLVGWHPKFLIPICDKFFKWHIPNGELEIRGINIFSTCKFCGKRICKDSQGNWFEMEGDTE